MKNPLLSLSLGLMACSGAPVPSGAQDTSPVHEVLAPAAFKERLAGDPGPLIDVRTPEEWNEGVIQGAQLLDYFDAGFRDAVLRTPHDRPVYLYCAAGGRSYKAALYMMQNGYTRIVELDGGMDAWRETGQMVVPPGSESKR